MVGSALWFFILLPILLLPSSAADISYVYDDASRLRAVIDPASDTAIYAYDSVGNLTGITRQSSSTLAVLQFTPSSSPVGTTVTIYGTGFSTTPASNTVKFNGTTATVLTASATVLTATVPSGATTGPISVTVGANTATSPASFTVGANPSPTISNFSPAVGTAGTAVTITGTNYDTTPTRNKVTFSPTYSVVATASSTSLSTTVPVGAQSGKIGVTTVNGSVLSTNEFFVTPSSVNVSGQAGNLTASWPAGCNAAYDAIGFFKRPPDNITSTIPPGWNSINGIIQQCNSQFPDHLPNDGSFYKALIRDLNLNIIVNTQSPNPLPTWCYWDPAKGALHDIWDQAAHPANNPNPPNWAPDPPAQQAKDGEKKNAGDPVELATGLFIMEQIDLAIPDLIPLTLTRTYRQNDTASRPFGIGRHQLFHGVLGQSKLAECRAAIHVELGCRATTVESSPQGWHDLSLLVDDGLSATLARGN